MARKKLDTLTEPMYYILLSLTEPRHGYGIMQHVHETTGGRVALGAGTLYALLSRFEEDGIIENSGEEEKRKYYKLTEKGMEILKNEYERLIRQVADGAAALGGDKA